MPHACSCNKKHDIHENRKPCLAINKTEYKWETANKRAINSRQMIRKFGDHIWSANIISCDPWTMLIYRYSVWPNEDGRNPKNSKSKTKQLNEANQSKIWSKQTWKFSSLLYTIQWNYEIKSQLCNVSGLTIFTPNKQNKWIQISK